MSKFEIKFHIGQFSKDHVKEILSNMETWTGVHSENIELKETEEHRIFCIKDNVSDEDTDLVRSFLCGVACGMEIIYDQIPGMLL